MIDRRTMIGAVAISLGSGPVLVNAQAALPRRIGYLGNGIRGAPNPQREAFRQSLHELGWIEGRNLTIDIRWAEGRHDRVAGLLAEFVQAKVDVIVVSGATAIRAAQKATSAIPVVFVVLADPVAPGFVASLGRPGGNMTGVASQFEELITKQLQLLKEALPRLTRVALLLPPDIAPAVVAAAETSARSLGLSTRRLNVAAAGELESVFLVAKQAGVEAIQVLPSPWFFTQRARLVELAARFRLPAFYEFGAYVQDGGLMSYGPNIVAMHGRAASYVDRILKGAKPADMPIELTAHFELFINLKTAAALGLTLPQSLMHRADKVIE